jgi:hypothetical protein
MKRKILLITAITFLNMHAFAQSVVSTKTGPPGLWQQLGTLNVDSPTLIHDDIVLAGPAEFRSLKFKATDGDVQVENVSVIYQNGQVDQMNIKYLVPAGGESRIIDLKMEMKSGVRKIRRVTVWYQPAEPGNLNHPKLSLWAMK